MEELHKLARRNYPRRKFNVKGLDETWQSDLIEMQPYAPKNKGIKYRLTVIGVLSKFAWAVPVKRKTAQDVTAAMGSVLQQGRVPSNLQTDKGKEFYNANFQNLMSRYHRNHYSTYSNLKASEIFTMNRVMPTSPVTYKLKDYQDKPIADGFYEEELLETKYADVYLVKEVLKQRGDRAYVKWLGFDSSHNSWIDKSDL